MRRWYVTVYAALMSAARFLSDNASFAKILRACGNAESRRLVSVPDARFLKRYIERANDKFGLSGNCRRLVDFCDKLNKYLDAVNTTMDQMAADAVVADRTAADAVVDLEALARELGLPPLPVKGTL